MRRRGAEDHRIVFTYGDTNIRHSDIATLAPRAWLGDNLLAYHCEVLNKHTKQLFWPPTIVELLCAFPNKETLTSLLPLQDLKDTTDNLWLIGTPALSDRCCTQQTLFEENQLSDELCC